MTNIASFRTDEKKQAEGVVKYLDDQKTCWIRVSPANNGKFQKEMRRLFDNESRLYRNKKLPDEASMKLTRVAMARTILVEMHGFTDGHGDITGTKGAPIPDTLEMREKVMGNPAYREFADMVATIAQESENFRMEVDEEELGKSEGGSDGVGHGDHTQSS